MSLEPNSAELDVSITMPNRPNVVCSASSTEALVPRSSLLAAPSALPPAAYCYTETQDWFSHNIPSWRALFPLITSPTPRALEIGSWEGRSAVFLLTSLCQIDGEVVCIDHFALLRVRQSPYEATKSMNSLGADLGDEVRLLQFPSGWVERSTT